MSIESYFYILFYVFPAKGLFLKRIRSVLCFTYVGQALPRKHDRINQE